MTPTEKYIAALARINPGTLSLLRTHCGQGLDESVPGFDIFTGLWWPLRAKSERAPRRGVAWLVAKLFAAKPLKHCAGQTLALQLGRARPASKTDRKRFDDRFDRMLSLPIERIEPALRWALDTASEKRAELDWVALTDDLSLWERESKRLKWANEFLKPSTEK